MINATTVIHQALDKFFYKGGSCPPRSELMHAIVWERKNDRTTVAVFDVSGLEVEQKKRLEMFLSDSVDSWYRAQVIGLTTRVNQACQEMGKMGVTPEILEVDSESLVPERATFLGLKVHRTWAPEKVLSAPSFGRYVLLPPKE